METINDYYYGNEAEQYIFYRLPKMLMNEPQFKHLTSDAKILYGMMLDRMGLSIKNGWKDDDGKVYIYFTLEDTQEYMNCGHTKGVKIIAELENIGLIERIKQGQGKPTRIYVKKFFTKKNDNSPQKQESYPHGNQDISKMEVQTSANEKSRLPQSRSADFHKTDTNNNDFNKKDFNDIDFKNSESKSSLICEKETELGDVIDSDIDNDDLNEYPLKAFFSLEKKQKQLEQFIKEQINYEWLLTVDDIDKSEVDSFVFIMLETLLSDCPTIRINGEDKPQAVVKSVLSKVNPGSIIYSIAKFKEQSHEIKHKKSYLLTCLYNAQIEGIYNGINYLKQMGLS